MTAVEWFFNQMEQMQYFIGNDLYSAYKEAIEMEKQQTSPKADDNSSFGEISDAKIYDTASKIGIASNIANAYWIDGAKWYREQLKCKGNGNK